MTKNPEQPENLYDQIRGYDLLAPEQHAILAAGILPRLAYLQVRTHPSIEISREDENIVAELEDTKLVWAPGAFFAICTNPQAPRTIMISALIDEITTRHEISEKDVRNYVAAVNIVGVMLQQAGIDTDAITQDMRARAGLELASTS